MAKAKHEGKVTIYSSQGLDVLNDLAAKFKDKYGITLEVVRGIDSELIPKVDAENHDGQPRGGRLRLRQRPVGRRQRRQGDVRGADRARRSTTRTTTRRRFVSADGTQFVSTAAVFGYAWNTDRYSNGIKGYAGALDPALADGKVGGDRRPHLHRPRRLLSVPRGADGSRLPDQAGGPEAEDLSERAADRPGADVR